jgi:hypothetical protein
LVLRRSKDGDKMGRAAAGRWSARIEAGFLDGLEACGCVRTAAAAAGVSTATLYNRRGNYPEFAARWDEAKARARTHLPDLLNAAALESLGAPPEGAKRRGRTRLPPVSVDQGIRIVQMNANAAAKARGPARRGGISSREERPEPTREELVETFTRLMGMMKRRRERQRLKEGWTRLDNGLWLPPGWTAQGPPPDAGAADPPSA